MTKAICLLPVLALLVVSSAHATWANPDLDAGLATLALSHTAAEAQMAAQTLQAQFGLAQFGLGQFGLTLASAPVPIAHPKFALGGAALVEMVDMRLLLAQIAVQSGAKDHLALTRAQGDGGHQVILLRGGFVTLAQLQSLMSTSAASAFVVADRQGLTLTRALVIWPDAGLSLSSGDTLILSQADGSFLANLGWLNIQGASVRGSQAANLGAPSFRPFVFTAGQGSLTVSDASFAHLGFGDAARFGGVSVDNSGLRAPKTPPVITQSTFEDVKTLAMISTKSAILSDNTVAGGSILIAHSQSAVVAANFLTSATTASIRITSGSSQTQVSGNVVLNGTVGISVDQASQTTTLASNVLAGQTNSGIRLDKMGCALVLGNLAAQGLGAGISLSGTGQVAIAGNAIFDNAGPGILVRAQGEHASLQITGNQLAGNHEGLRGATAGTLTLSGNDLEGQLPRLFTGDLAPHTIAWLEDRRSIGPTRLMTAPVPQCPDEGSN